MTTLSVGQLWDNDAPKAVRSASLAANTDLAVWTPAAGKKIRLRRIVISGSFAAGELIEVREGATVRAHYEWEDHIIMDTIPGEGMPPFAANAVLNVRHAGAANRSVTVIAYGREE